MPQTPKFSVGDRVKMTSASILWRKEYSNIVGTIKNIQSESLWFHNGEPAYTVLMSFPGDDRKTFAFNESELQRA